jgi:hypothetical protein
LCTSPHLWSKCLLTLLLHRAFLRFFNDYTPTNALLYIVFSLKFTLKHLKCSYIFLSSDHHHQGAYTVPC